MDDRTSVLSGAPGVYSHEPTGSVEPIGRCLSCGRKTDAGAGDAMPWERRADESPQAFAAFQAYRDQPSAERSLRRLMIQLGKSKQLIGDWSAKYQWVDRVEAWDRELDRIQREHYQKQRESFAERLAAEGALMQIRGIAKIRSFVDRYDADGHPVILRDGQRYTDEMSVSEATRLVESGARLEAIARGLPTTPVPGTTAPADIDGPAVVRRYTGPPLAGEAAELMDGLTELLSAEAPAVPG